MESSKKLLATIQNLEAYIARSTDYAEIDLMKKIVTLLAQMVINNQRKPY